MTGEDLTEEEKLRRAIWFVAVALSGYWLDRSAVSHLMSAGGTVPTHLDLSFFAIRGLLRICIAFGFIAYLSLWRHVAKRTTPILSLFKVGLFPLVAAIVPLVPVFRHSDRAWLPDLLAAKVLVPLFIVGIILSLSDLAFHELRDGSDNMRHSASRAYLSLLVAKVPPTERSDLWLLDCAMGVVIFIAAAIPIQ